MSARNSAASSQRALAAAPDGVTCPRMRSARATVISRRVPPGTRPQHRVQPAGGLVAAPGQVPVPFGPHLQHHGVVLGEHRARGLGPQRRDRHRPGVIRVVLVCVSGLQQPHPGGQLRRHIGHPFPGGGQLLGQQAPQPGGALHRPGPLRPRPRPRHQLGCLRRAGPHLYLSQRLLAWPDRHRRVRAFMRADPDHHHRHVHHPQRYQQERRPAAGMPNYSAGARASFEPRRGTARQAGTSISSQATNATGRRFGSQPTGPLQRYGPAHFHPGQVRNATGLN